MPGIPGRRHAGPNLPAGWLIPIASTTLATLGHTIRTKEAMIQMVLICRLETTSSSAERCDKIRRTLLEAAIPSTIVWIRLLKDTEDGWSCTARPFWHCRCRRNWELQCGLCLVVGARQRFADEVLCISVCRREKRQCYLVALNTEQRSPAFPPNWLF